jgi:hypothetical protein
MTDWIAGDGYGRFCRLSCCDKPSAARYRQRQPCGLVAALRTTEPALANGAAPSFSIVSVVRIISSLRGVILHKA